MNYNRGHNSWDTTVLLENELCPLLPLPTPNVNVDFKPLTLVPICQH